MQSEIRDKNLQEVQHVTSQFGHMITRRFTAGSLLRSLHVLAVLQAPVSASLNSSRTVIGQSIETAVEQHPEKIILIGRILFMRNDANLCMYVTYPLDRRYEISRKSSMPNLDERVQQ